jgi:hypothetical protein
MENTEIKYKSHHQGPICQYKSHHEFNTFDHFCPKCNFDNINTGDIFTTEVYYVPIIDNDGNQHEHDGNHVTKDIKCEKCSFQYSIIGRNVCECGWTSK